MSKLKDNFKAILHSNLAMGAIVGLTSFIVVYSATDDIRTSILTSIFSTTAYGVWKNELPLQNDHEQSNQLQHQQHE